MTIGDAIGSEIAVLRAEAESLLVDACLLQRRTGSGHPDPVTGHVDPVWETYWAGPCWVSSRGAARITSDGDRVADIAPVVKTSVHAPDPLQGHRYVITSRNDLTVYVTSVPEETHPVLKRVKCSHEMVLDR